MSRRVKDIEVSGILKNMISQVTIKEGQLELVKNIVSELTAEQKKELCNYMRGPEQNIEAAHNQFIIEAKAERHKLINSNKQQATYIQNLEAMQKELQVKIEDL